MKQERPVVFDCAGDRLVGILHPGAPGASTGVVIVVGGPQYRVGSHRQFVVMARHFAAAGIPVLRFDYRGMGDAEGAPRAFDTVGDDIRAAIDCLTGTMPGVTKGVLLGLCDAASANLIYGHTDNRVSGLILLNPWVRTTRGEAKAYLRHYYLQRMLQISFWRKVVSGELSVSRSLRDFLRTRHAARGAADMQYDVPKNGESFVARMREGFARFHRPVLFLISGRDLTAQEFVDLYRDDKSWRKAGKRSTDFIREFPEADHTMSGKAELERASECCIEWLKANSIA